jgi:hypothetical protein
MTYRLTILVMWFAVLASAQDPADTSASSSRRPRTTLELSSIPPGATVILDSVLVGATPAVFSEVPYGRHLVRMTLDGHADFIDTVNLRFGSIVRLSPRLLRTGMVRVSSNPPGVRVYLADTLAGFTPLEIAGLRPGRVPIRIEDPVYKPFRSYIFIPESDTARVSAELELRYVSMTAVAHNPEARILVDGLLVGTGELIERPVETGVRRVRFEDAETHQSVSATVRLGNQPVVVRSSSGAWQWTPVIASAILPGTGQMIDGSTSKGSKISAGFVALTGVSFLMNRTVGRRIDEYEEVRKKYVDYAGTSATELIELRKQAQASHDKAMTAWRWNLVPLVGAALLYVYNLTDVFLHHARGLEMTVNTSPSATVGGAGGVEDTVRITLGP